MLSSTRSSYTLSTVAHSIALVCLLFWNAHSHISKPKTLLVQTVRVKEFQPVAVQQKPAPKQAEPIAPPEPEVAVAEPVIAEPIVEEPKIEEPAPIDESKPQEEKKPDEVKQEEVKQEEVKQEEPQKPQPKKEQKPAPKKKKPDPAKNAKPKTDTSSNKKAADAKKQAQIKADKSKADKAKADKVKADKAKAAAEQAKAAADKLKQQNIQAALESLNKSSSKSKALVAVASEQISTVSKVGALESEHLQTISCEGVEAYATKEALYVSELIRRLKLALKLPEYGEVRVKMTLSRSGSVTQLSVLKSSSSINKKLVEQKLKGLTFAAFGASFAKEESHTFTLILSNES